MKYLITLLAFVIGAFISNNNHATAAKFENKEGIVLIGRTDNNLIGLLKQSDYLVIQQGNGGIVQGMMETIQYLKEHPEKSVVINGNCYSACTMLLSAKNVYLTENANFYFHSAANITCETNHKISIVPNMFYNIVMIGVFDTSIQKWIMSSKAFGKLTFTKLPDDYLYPFASNFIDASLFPKNENLAPLDAHLPIGQTCDPKNFKIM